MLILTRNLSEDKRLTTKSSSNPTESNSNRMKILYRLPTDACLYIKFINFLDENNIEYDTHGKAKYAFISVDKNVYYFFHWFFFSKSLVFYSVDDSEALRKLAAKYSLNLSN